MQSQDPVIGADKAVKLGLTSQRFHQSHMGQHAEEAIEYVKRKDRPQLKLEEWRRQKYYKSEAFTKLWDCPDQVQRRENEQLTVSKFVEQYEKPCKPVIIRGCTKDWPTQKWSHEWFYRRYKDMKFKVGEDNDGYKLRVQFKHYLEYLVYNKDDSPLYLFESSLESKPELQDVIDNYQVPKYFRDDLFRLAGERRRPPYRWFIMGPQRSGTTVHTDPLMTSAWNTSLAGHKRWICFHGSIPKSIVKGKQFRPRGYEDEAINYFCQILPKMRAKYGEQLQAMEFIQYPGETVFVPGGVWHAVINLDDTIAITQNVMTHYGFDSVWRSTRCERRKFAQMFLDRLKENDEELYNRAITLNKADGYEMGNKYAKQEVSLSFTPSSSSSSSSSSGSSSSSSSDSGDKRKHNRVTTSHHRSGSLSRSRQNKPRPFSTGRNEKKSKRAIDV